MASQKRGVPCLVSRPGVFRRLHLVDVNAETWKIVGPEHRVVQPALLQPRENLIIRVVGVVSVVLVVESALRELLDAERGRGQIDREICHHSDRRAVARAVQSDPDTEKFAERGELDHRREAADVAHVDADEVDETVLDQGQILVDVDKELPHRNRHGRVLTHDPEVLALFWRQRVLQEEEPVGLQRLGQLDGRGGRQALVRVVAELDGLPCSKRRPLLRQLFLRLFVPSLSW
jgi:hypothetical protein